MATTTAFTDPDFYGPDYDPALDLHRLRKQQDKIYHVMKDSGWRTLAEIESKTLAPQASISAQLRGFRRRRYGSHILNRRRRGNPSTGLYEYQLVLNPLAATTAAST